MSSIRIHRRVPVHRGRVFSLHTDRVTLPNDATIDIDVVRHPGAAAVVPFLDPGTLVLIRQYRYAVEGEIWEIPAGTLSPGESARDCAERELSEETGYAARRWEKLGEVTPVPGYSDERIHLFEAADLSLSAQNLDRDEVLSVHPVRLEAAIEMILRGEIQDGKTIAGIFLARLRRKGP